jgi:hypothetical protein
MVGVFLGSYDGPVRIARHEIEQVEYVRLRRLAEGRADMRVTSFVTRSLPLILSRLEGPRRGLTFVMVDYHGHRQALSGPDQAGELFAAQAEAILPHGGSGQTIWIGPADAPERLRIDVDIAVGRTAVRWIPDGVHAVDLGPGGPITVLASPDAGLTTVPPALARAGFAAARRAVAEYVATGRRPTCLTWRRDDES